MRLILGLLLVFYSFPTLACRQAMFDIKQELGNADVVAVAYVTGIFVSNAEEILIGNTEDKDIQMSYSFQRSIRVLIDKQLKGVADQVYEVNVSCAFLADLLEKVILIRKGDKVWVRELDDSEENIIKILD